MSRASSAVGSRRDSRLAAGCAVFILPHMTTLTIELPDEAARVAEAKARLAHMSLSEWIGSRIAGRRALRANGGRDAMGYPGGWFARTSGSLAGVDDFREPPDAPLKAVAPLEL
jgi:cytosine/adenosine deaminase-related metal-dependent hydrolase